MCLVPISKKIDRIIFYLFILSIIWGSFVIDPACERVILFGKIKIASMHLKYKMELSLYLNGMHKF